MNDWVIGAIHVAAAVLIFFFGWICSAQAIRWECRHLGMFYVSSNVFECKEKQ
jgi:hypothetical protein